MIRYFFQQVHGFDESRITYNLDGNIKTLQRNSFTQGTNNHIRVDSLSYSYRTDIPDQLNTVTDGTGANYTGYGFKNLTNSSGSYAYDNNGNLTSDPYKGLSLQYDYLNRTDKITVTTATNRYIYYTYDATGKMIRKQVYDNNNLQNTTDYIDGYVYITPAGGSPLISYFPMPEGRVLNTSATGVSLVQEFIITDQQGNARVSFENNGSGAAVVTQENSYYGFGLVMPNSPVGTTLTSNKQLYNGGSEWQNDYTSLPDYYQTYYRNYDAALARWVGVDPMAESAESMTTYQYAGNNPIMFNDPLGNLLDPSRISKPAGGATYTGWQPSTGGGMDNSLLDGFASDADNIGSDGLYATDPGLANYLGNTYGDQIFHAGNENDPTATILDPTRGSLANAVGFIAAAGVNIVNENGNINIPGGYKGGIATYAYNDGRVMAEPNSINDDQYQLANNSWVDGASQGGISLTGHVEINTMIATFGVNGINASGLQVIQVYHGSGGISGNLAFVDGGINSPYARQMGGPAQPGKPYYLTPSEFAGGVTWNGTNGYLTLNDRQTGGYYNDISNFEVILVATNYNGSGADRLLGGFTWSYNNYQLSINGSVVPSGFQVLTNATFSPNVSPTAIQIIRNDYPGYRFTQ